MLKYFKKHKYISVIYITLVILIGFFGSKLIGKAGNDFSRGVMALDTDKSTYAPGEKMTISMASFDLKGQTLCHSNLKLEITGPKKNTSNIAVTNSPTCSGNEVTNDPDYLANYQPGSVGKYVLKLTNLDSNKIVETDVNVSKSLAFDIQRSGAIRVNPFKLDRYPMIIVVTANKDFQGEIAEKVPASFDIIWQGLAKISQKSDSKILSWNVNIKANETLVLRYEYSVPKVSPQLYKLGPVTVGNKIFDSLWQIVSNSK